VTFSYIAPGVSDQDTVRFLIQDTTEAEAKVSDEEIQWAITTWMPLYGTVQYVASTIAETIAARYAQEASYSADGVSVSLGPVGDQYRALAANLRMQHQAVRVGAVPDVGGMTPGEVTPEDIAAFAFGTGMHDDIEAGQQDYGGKSQPFYIPEFYPGA
jgi:hypothetical protein